MYCIVNDANVITNIIVAEQLFAESIGALAYYDGATIGDSYVPPIPISKEDRLEAQVAYTAMMTDTLIGG